METLQAGVGLQWVKSRHKILIACIALPLLSRGMSPAVAQESTPQGCLRNGSPEACLDGFGDEDQEAAAVWMFLAEQYLARREMAKASQAFRKAGDQPGAAGLALFTELVGEKILFQPLRDRRIRQRARSILSQDATDAGANLIMGSMDLREISARHGRVALPANLDAEEVSSRLSFVGSGGMDSDRLRDIYRGEEQPISVSRTNRADRLARRARDRLTLAFRDDRLAESALRELGKLHLLARDYAALGRDASVYRRRFPERPMGYLLGSLAAQREGRSEAASMFGELGLERLAVDKSREVLDPSAVLSTAVSPPDDVLSWWREQDPIALTSRNERLTEHLTRWTYADIVVGGGATTRGQVIVRYGIPEAVLTYTGGGGVDWDRFSVYRYPGFSFRFMDLARTGEWAFYSPNSRAFEGNRANTEVRSNDYVLLARERFRDTPVRFEPSWEVRSLNAAVFRGANGGFDVVTMGRVPVDLGKSDHGAMVLDDGSRIASRDVRPIEPWEPGEMFVHEIHVTRRNSASFSSRVEAVAASTVSSDSRTIVFRSGRIRTPPSVGLATSSILLATRIDEAGEGSELASWERRGLRITPSPDGAFDADAPVYAYFEIYGLQLGAAGKTDYEVTATLKRDDSEGRPFLARLFGRRDGSVGAGFTSSGSEPDTGDYLLLDVLSQKPGEYLLTLNVLDRTTQSSVETTTRLRIQ